jgi:hypothetical protein
MTTTETRPATTTAFVKIADQQNPWIGCTVPVLASLPDGSVRVRASEMVMLTLQPGEYQPTPLTWQEPDGCTTPRGWLYAGEVCVGNYLDYGPDHYRSPHEYCRGACHCWLAQPGNIHAVRYPGGPGTANQWSYFETIGQAREYIERGLAEREQQPA